MRDHAKNTGNEENVWFYANMNLNTQAKENEIFFTDLFIYQVYFFRHKFDC